MTLSIRSPLLRRAAVVLFVFGGLAACQKNDASAGQVAGKLNDAAQAASQKLDQAASYVGQKVDETKSAAQQNLESASAPSVTIDPNALASSAQANLQNAASAAQAQLGKPRRSLARASKTRGASSSNGRRKTRLRRRARLLRRPARATAAMRKSRWTNEMGINPLAALRGVGQCTLRV